MQKFKIVLPLLLVAVLGFLAWTLFKPDSAEQQNDNISADVLNSSFSVHVTAEGELQAKRSKQIMGPASMRTASIWETTIQDLVPEGTVVKEGDYVANLDKTELQTKMNDIQVEIDKITSQMEQAQIDSSIEMKELRDHLANIQFDMEENELQVELNRYEPEAIIRQKAIELEKSKRELVQQETKIQLTKEKNLAKLAEIQASLRQEQNKMDRLLKLADEFRVLAPADGMVIYARNWDGKVTPGSRLRAWNPIVAELPDLSEMISKTYINEVDIAKVKPGMEAAIYVDAFPDKTYSGVVQKVANIGEQLRNTDSKVFEVIVSIEESDSILRPAMTTRIEILTETFEDALSIPLEALYNDSLPFVYALRDKKLYKQEVLALTSNDMRALVGAGLNATDVVLLNAPDNEKELAFIYLSESEKKSAKDNFEALRSAQLKALEERRKLVDNNAGSNNKAAGGNIIFF